MNIAIIIVESRPPWKLETHGAYWIQGSKVIERQNVRISAWNCSFIQCRILQSTHSSKPRDIFLFHAEDIQSGDCSIYQKNRGDFPPHFTHEKHDFRIFFRWLRRNRNLRVTIPAIFGHQMELIIPTCTKRLLSYALQSWMNRFRFNSVLCWPLFDELVAVKRWMCDPLHRESSKRIFFESLRVSMLMMMIHDLCVVARCLRN